MGNFTREIVRKDTKQRIVGDKAYIGDQEIIGKLSVYDDNENLVFFVDPDTGLVKYYDTSGNLIFVFDTSTGQVIYYNTAGSEIYKFDPTTGDLTINGDKVNTNAEIFSHVSVEHFWTGSGTYIDRTGAFFALNGDNFNNQEVYFEGVMAVEQAGRTAYQRIYNVTDGTVLTGSEITSTTVGISSPERVRSGNLAGNLPSGEKVYKLQIKQSPAGNGGDNAHFYAARLVHVQE